MELGSLQIDVRHDGMKRHLLVQGRTYGVEEPNISLQQCQSLINYLMREIEQWPISVPK